METYGSTMERARWTDEGIDGQMRAIDQTFERINESLRDLRDEVRAMRGDLTAEITAQRGDIASLAGRVDRLQDRLVQIGFGMTGVFAAGLIALVATQL